MHHPPVWQGRLRFDEFDPGFLAIGTRQVLDTLGNDQDFSRPYLYRFVADSMMSVPRH